MKKFVVICALLFAFGSFVYANNTVGRYITVQEEATPAQKDLLSQSIHVQFPTSIHTIEDAMKYCLQFSGYSLVSHQQQNSALQIILTKPLPVIDRDFGPMSLREALSTLIGSAFTLQEDKLNRTVNFVLKNSFKVVKS